MEEKPMIDAIDRARFGKIEIEEHLSKAFKRKFGDPEDTDTQIIMDYLSGFCGYGFAVTDKEQLLCYGFRTQVLMEIKKLTAATKTFKMEDEDPAPEEIDENKEGEAL